MKRLTIGKDIFVKGWTRCADCDKRIRYMLRADVAIMCEGLLNICTDCYWAIYSKDNKVAAAEPIIFRTFER